MVSDRNVDPQIRLVGTDTFTRENSYRRCYHPEDEDKPLSQVVLQVIEDHESTSLTADEFSVYEHVNPGAIDMLFADTDVPISVQIDLENVRVGIWSDGGFDIRVVDPMDETNRYLGRRLRERRRHRWSDRACIAHEDESSLEKRTVVSLRPYRSRLGESKSDGFAPRIGYCVLDKVQESPSGFGDCRFRSGVPSGPDHCH